MEDRFVDSKTNLTYLKSGKTYNNSEAGYTAESNSPVVDVDKEFFKLKNWKKAEGYDSNVDLTKMGRPFAISISNSSSSSISGVDVSLVWSGDSTNGYTCKIPYGTFYQNSDGTVNQSNETENTTETIGHHKGAIAVDGNYPTGVGFSGSSNNLIVPRVKTYSKMSTDNDYEEVYDSASINIRNGEVTVYSDVNSPLYLVLIY